MSLATLGLSQEILRALKDKGYQKATPIQKELIPAMFLGRDIMAGAQTGTGKTAGFVLPILQELMREFKEGSHTPKAIIIVPTRELARQVHENVDLYAKYLPLKTSVLYGGSNMTSQTNRLKQGVDIVVATPGRLLEHIGKKNLTLDMVKHLVLDEADTILDMGFIYEVTQIISYLPKKRQTVLISATLSGSVKRLAKQILNKPKLIEVDSMGSFAKNVKQIIHPVSSELKMELLSFLIGSKNYQQVLVFVRKKQEADEVAKELNLSGLKTLVIHGDKSAGARARVLEAFKDGKIRVLVATDIAARGIDIPSLEVVINYDIPHIIGDFIHRIGRTGRAGKDGLAITLLSPKEEIAMRDVEHLMGKAIKRVEIEGYAPEEEKTQRDTRKIKYIKKRVNGAFGKKKSSTTPTKKKRKVTKRDSFKNYDLTKSKKSTQKKSQRKDKNRKRR